MASLGRVSRSHVITLPRSTGADSGAGVLSSMNNLRSSSRHDVRACDGSTRIVATARANAERSQAIPMSARYTLPISSAAG
jgi:methylase of polypeptide subunit release factors